MYIDEYFNLICTQSYIILYDLIPLFSSASSCWILTEMKDDIYGLQCLFIRAGVRMLS